MVDCIVNLPAKLFLNTQIPASLWFIKRGRKTKDILFIDARNKGHLINRRTKEFSDDDITEIAQTYHNWKLSCHSELDSKSHKYEDIKGFCKSASYEEVAELNYVLTPGRYVGLEEVEDDFNFAERFTSLKTQLAEQMQQEEALNQRIMDNLAKIKIAEE
nr:N-6 DNA methylase [Francisella tularensis]